MRYFNPIYDMKYVTDSNNVANEKLRQYHEFNKIIKNNNLELSEDDLDKLNKIIDSCEDCADYVNLILALPVQQEMLYKVLYLFNMIAFRIATKYDHNNPCFNKVYEHFRKFELFILSNKDLLNDEKIDQVMRDLGYTINTLERVNEKSTIDYVYYLTPKTLHSTTIVEDTQYRNTSDSIIRSDNNDGQYTSVNVVTVGNPKTDLNRLLMEDDYSHFISKIKLLFSYLLALQGDYNDENTKLFIDAINFTFHKVIDNVTGKEILLNTLSKCDDFLSSRPNIDDSNISNVETILTAISKIIEAMNEYPGGETILLYEMGLGYIYDVFPKNESEIDSNINKIITSLNEYSEELDVISSINESIKDSISEYREKRKAQKKKEKEYREKKKDEKYEFFDKTKGDRLDVERHRVYDDYDLEKDSKRDKYDDRRELKKQVVGDIYGDHRQRRDDKYDLKAQKRQDDYDFKRRKKLDRYERKMDIKDENRDIKLARDEEQRQAKAAARQQRRDETKIGINRWKTLELTSPNVRKATVALRKAVRAGAAGGVGALAGLNPIFAGSAYLVSSYVKDQKNPQHERRRYIDEIKSQIIEIDEKIRVADSKDEEDKKIALMKMKEKLSATLRRCGYLAKFETDM